MKATLVALLAVIGTAAGSSVWIGAYNVHDTLLSDDVDDGQWTSFEVTYLNTTHYYHESATYYLVGTGPTVVEFWQPFDDTLGGGKIGGMHINVSATFVESQRFANGSDSVTVNVSNAGWGNVVGADICTGEAGVPCPALVMCGTTQIATRYENGDMLSLNTYLGELAQELGYALTDDFVKFYFYDFSYNGNWMAVPLISDVRVMAYNATTFANLGMDEPPPQGSDWGETYSDKWTWEKVTEYAKQITAGTGQPGFSAKADWDEDLKMSMTVARSYNTYMYTTNELDVKTCALNTPEFVAGWNKTFGQMLTDGSIETVDGFIHTTPYNDSGAMNYNFETWNASWSLNTDPTEFAGTLYSGEAFSKDDSNVMYGMALLPPAVIGDSFAAATASGEVKEGYAPGRLGFLGGSGLFVTANTSSEQQRLAWLLLQTMTDAVTQYGLIARSPPPFESAWEEYPWNTDAWATSIKQIKASVPPQYPLASFGEFGTLEGLKPFRQLWMETMYQGIDAVTGIERMCLLFDKIFAPVCTDDDHTSPSCVICSEEDWRYNVSHCSRDLDRFVSFYWASGAEDCVGGVDLPADGTIGCDHVPADSTFGIAIAVISALGAAVALTACTGVLWYRSTAIIRFAQPAFCGIFTLGVAALCLSNYTLLGPITEPLCLSQVWVWGIAFDVAFSALFSKVWRVWRIMESAKQMKRIKLTVQQTMSVISFIVGVDVVILVVWSAVAPPRPTPYYETTSDGVEIEQQKCSSSASLFEIVFLLYKLVLIIWGCYLSWVTRKCSSELSESKQIMYSMYNFAVLALMVAIVLAANVDIQYVAIVKMLVFVLGGNFAVVAVLGPRLLMAFRGRDISAQDVTLTSAPPMTSNNYTRSEGGRSPSTVLTHAGVVTNVDKEYKGCTECPHCQAKRNSLTASVRRIVRKTSTTGPGASSHGTTSGASGSYSGGRSAALASNGSLGNLEVALPDLATTMRVGGAAALDIERTTPDISPHGVGSHGGSSRRTSSDEIEVIMRPPLPVEEDGISRAV
ncbi:unnamed protein product [Phaeothamnion confervicola]